MSEFLSGTGLGIALFAIVIGALWAAGSYEFDGWGKARFEAGPVTVARAVFEETLFRGLLFRFISVLAGTWVALLGTSALFGLAHGFNPGATLLSSVAVGLEAGVLLGAAYVVTGRLWLPVGIHAGWNFAEGPIFGMAESGGPAIPGLIDGKLHGRVLLTGGAFGPEASIIAVIVCLVSASAIL